MSCYIVNRKEVILLAAIFFNLKGDEVETPIQARLISRIATELWKANVDAVNERYGGRVKPEVVTSNVQEINDIMGEVGNQWQVLKCCRHFLYQCRSMIGFYEADAYQKIQAIIYVLGKNGYTDECDEYNQATWGLE